MTNFPDPINLPDSVFSARHERNKQLVSSAKSGVYIRLFIITAEIISAFVFSSYAILMDGIASFVDVFFSLSLIYFIKYADRPPDENHPFGHGRLEPLIGMQIGVLIAGIGFFALYEQFSSFAHVEQVSRVSPYAWIVPFCAVALLEICYRVVMSASKKQNSPALAADAFHYRIDAITSALAAVALIFATTYPETGNMIDRFGAIAISFFMIGIGIYAAKNNLYQLIDTTPDKTYFETVKEAALKVDGVFDTEKIRIQLYGPDAHVNIDIEVEPKMNVEDAHEITQRVRAEIQKAWPAVRDVTVHVEPYYPGDH